MADLDRGQGGLIDDISRPLRVLGCPLNPRRYQAICRFIASTPSDICSAWQALDLQIAQRLIPQIQGGMFCTESQNAVESMVSILERHGEKFTESLEALRAIRESEFDSTSAQEE